MKKKGFIIAIAVIVTFILAIVVCAAVADKQKPSEPPSAEQTVSATVVQATLLSMREG